MTLCERDRGQLIPCVTEDSGELSSEDVLDKTSVGTPLIEYVTIERTIRECNEQP